MKISVLLAVTITSLGVHASAGLSVVNIQLSHIEGCSLTDIKSIIVRAGGSGPTYRSDKEAAIIDILRNNEGVGHINPEQSIEPQLKNSLLINQKNTN